MLTVTLSGAETLDRMAERSSRIAEVVRTKLDLLDIKLQSHIVQDKLAGQVLKHRTGALANSIRAIPAEVEGSIVRGTVQGAGGPAWYGRLHEYGTTRTYEIVPKTKQALRFIIDGKVIFAKHVLHPPLKERSFMRTSAAEMQEEMRSGIQDAVVEGCME